MQGLAFKTVTLARHGETEWNRHADADRRAGIALIRISTVGARCPLIVSHEMIGRMLLRRLLGADPRTALGWHHPHDVIYQVAVDKREVTEFRVESQMQYQPSGAVRTDRRRWPDSYEGLCARCRRAFASQ